MTASIYVFLLIV